MPRLPKVVGGSLAVLTSGIVVMKAPVAVAIVLGLVFLSIAVIAITVIVVLRTVLRTQADAEITPTSKGGIRIKFVSRRSRARHRRFWRRRR